jgi:hypothetical protein
LARLIDEARAAAREARLAIELDGVEARRLRALRYGRAILAIKEMYQNDDKGFGQCLQRYDLAIGDQTYRYGAMWLAKNWDTLDLSNCPHASPKYIRQWCTTDQKNVVAFR